MTAVAGPRPSPERLAPAVALVNAALFAFLALSQWVGWGGPDRLASSGAPPAAVVAVGWYVLGVDLATSAGFVLLYFRVPAPPVARPWPRRLLVAAGLAAGTATVRAVALEPVGDPVGLGDDLVDWGAAVVGQVVAVAAALLVADLVARAQDEARRRAEHELRAARHAAELEHAEALRRRVVADRLHGTVQNKLALICAGIDDVAAEVPGGGPAERLRELAEMLDRVREDDVRALSHEILPTALEVSLVRALRTVLDRLPPSLSGSLVVGAGYEARTARREAELVDLATRALVVDAVEEGLTNAVRHGGARRAEVHLDAEEDTAGTTRLRVRVVDHGRGLTGEPPEWNGLRRHAERLRLRGGWLRLAGRSDGATLELAVPALPAGGG